MAYKRLRDTWEEALAYTCSSADRKLLADCVEHYQMRVKMRFFLPKPPYTTLWDPDNIHGVQKVVLDAMKRVHFIKDDSAKWIVLLAPEQTFAAKPGLTIIDIDPIYAEAA